MCRHKICRHKMCRNEIINIKCVEREEFTVYTHITYYIAVCVAVLIHVACNEQKQITSVYTKYIPFLMPHYQLLLISYRYSRTRFLSNKYLIT